jgi:bifunctional UDP-N-acetylglucosamine pyrophosphorylase/glucosamine-1-phosphate N-acetyltransferase
MPPLIEKLIHKGVRIPNPQSVEIGSDICVDRIAGRNVTIFSGSKVFGEKTLICEGTQIGFEAPATVVNCYVGPEVALKGGFFQDATFLKQSSCAFGAHIRYGTILEEKVRIAHTVGLKQTILFPYVTLGSLINFCDCLMAGGTSPVNHSEVGSSYIHFNYTPNQDKATPSLLGDVPRGVMLKQSPIFLGGQGGLVGPCQLAFGTVVAAGTICRKDQLDENYLIMDSGPRSARIPFLPGRHLNLRRILNHNFGYIANLIALNQWYQQIRSRFIGPDYPLQLAEGLFDTLGNNIAERIKQLKKLKKKLEGDSIDKGGIEEAFCHQWQQIEELLQGLKFYEGSTEYRDQFLTFIEHGIQKIGQDYLCVIKDLSSHQATIGSQWLQSIVNYVTASTVSKIVL